MNYSYGSNADQYLNKDGLEHLIEQLDLRYSGSGTVDLTNYYNKAEIDNLLANIDGGTGSDGRGIQSVELINYELIITLTDATVINLGNVRGEQGIQGQDGVKGDKGDKGEQGIQGDKGLDGKDGKDGSDGSDGVSPTITVATNTDTVYSLSITDTNGTITTPNLKGQDGADGEGGSGGGSSFADDYTLNTEMAIGKWVDGKVLYRKTIQLDSITLNTHILPVTSFGDGLNPIKFGGLLCTDWSEFVPVGFWESASSFCSAMFTDYSGNIKIFNKVGSTHGTDWAYGFVWLEYTKK